MDDLLISSLIGLVIGGGLLVILQRYPGKPFRYDFHDDEQRAINPPPQQEQVGDPSSSQNTREYTVNEVLEKITEEDVLKKTTKLRKVLGIDEEIVRKAVRKTKDEAKSGNASIDDDTNILKITDWIVFLVLIFVGLYFLNFASNGQVYRVFHGLFPEEFETLKLPRPT